MDLRFIIQQEIRMLEERMNYPQPIATLLQRRTLMPLDGGISDMTIVEELDVALIERLFGKMESLCVR